MSSTVSKALADVPLKMLRKEPARSEGLLNVVQERQKHAEILWRAAQIAGIASDKELAAELGSEDDPITKSQLSAWKSGAENPQTWRWERHPVLGPAYLFAQAEKRGGGRFVVDVPLLKVGT
jgi:hypothetical protein